MTEGAYTGVPGYPFDNPNKFMKTNPRGDVSIAAINNFALTPTKPDQMLYFDFYVDNPYPFWFIPDSMSRFGAPPEDGTNYTIHSARIDLYDADLLVPPGNFSHLAQLLFDPYEANYGGEGNKSAWVAAVLAPEDIASLPNLAAMGFNVPLGEYIGRNLLFVFRYATNVYPLSIGIDNVSIISCLPLDAQPLENVLASNGTAPAGSNSTAAPAASPSPAGGNATGTVQPTAAGRKLMTKLHGFGSLYPQADA
jgi:hypothetical protein